MHFTGLNSRLILRYSVNESSRASSPTEANSFPTCPSRYVALFEKPSGLTHRGATHQLPIWRTISHG
jgi:hypothetical protein